MAQQPISVFIIAKDEIGTIEACLQQAAKIADEIVLVDSGSTDGTLELAQKYCSTVVHQDWLGYAKQKNFALSLCKNNWVMSLDADEVLTDKAVEEIQGLDLTNVDAVKIARKLFIGETFIRYAGFYPDYHLRLFPRELGRYADTNVHESVELKGVDGNYSANATNILKLKNPLNHYSYNDLDEMAKAYAKFGELANQNIPEHKKNSLKASLKAIYTFLYKFFVRLGFLHGMLGYKIVLINAKYTFAKWNKAK